jgi:hypothetical protein
MIERVEPTKDDVAKIIAEAHRAIEPSIERIYRITGSPEREADPNEPIVLLEINASSTASGIVPVGFPPHPQSGVIYPSVIIEIHPDELNKLESHELTLPYGLQLDFSRKL